MWNSHNKFKMDVGAKILKKKKKSTHEANRPVAGTAAHLLPQLCYIVENNAGIRVVYQTHALLITWSNYRQHSKVIVGQHTSEAVASYFAG